MPWSLTETISTSAGAVAAGRSGSGPALVLAHGWPWSSYAWHRVIPAFEKHYTVHVFDMPGFGQSMVPTDQPTAMDVQGRVFVEVLAHWGLQRPSVVAHDFGGAVTLRAHLLHGADFERYVLMNVVAMRPWGSAFFDHVGRHVEAFLGLPPHIHRAVVTAYIESAFAAPLSEADINALTAPWLNEAGQRSFYKQFAQADEAFTAEVEPMFGQLRCPTSVIWGEDDPWIPLARGQALAAAVGQGRLHVIKDAGHMPQLEQPDTAANAILRKLQPV